MRRVLVVALLLGLTACSAADPSPSASPGASGAAGAAVRTAGCKTSADPAVDSTVDSAVDRVDVAGQIGIRGEADFAAVFAGARVGDEGVEVYRKPSAELDAWITATFAASCVILHDARFSAADLAKRYEQIGDDNTYWAEQGVHVNSVSSDFVRGVVIVGTSEVEKAKPLFAARYADGAPVELVDEAPA